MNPTHSDTMAPVSPGSLHPDNNLARLMRSRLFDAHISGRMPFHHSVSVGYVGGVENAFIEVSKVLPGTFTIVRTSEATNGVVLEVSDDDVLALIIVQSRKILVDAVSAERQRAIDFCALIKNHFYVAPVKDDRIAFSAWFHEDWQGDEEFNEREPWKAMRHLYPGAVATELDSLMALGPSDFAKSTLVIFTGVPGTGKTSVLKSLMTEWDEWASFDVIQDPEKYMSELSYRSKVMKANRSKQWRVVILEDADAYIQAQPQRSAAMTTLLNSVDGLVGSKYPTIHLFTSNLKRDGVEAALARPGRCRAHIHFELFSPAEARDRYGRYEHVSLAQIMNSGDEAKKIGENVTNVPFGFYL